MPATEMNSNSESGASSSCQKRPRAESDLELFDELFPTLVDQLTKQGRQHAEISVAMDWFKKVLEYNVPHGKKNRGLAVVQSYEFLVTNPSHDNLHIARVLGWCIELLQAFFLVADDVMDNSTTRRGKPCWYKCPGVGLEAVNDSYFLECAVYALLRHHCQGKPYYVRLLELFHETTLQTVTGQCLDMISSGSDEVDFSQYTLDRYKAIVKWKTAYYSFYLPVACALYLAGIDDQDLHTKAKEILLRMGEYFQIQDDYLDCFGDPAVTGKVGTDIQDNKCSWFVIQALQRASPAQRQLLQDNYAQQDPVKVAAVKELYRTLDLETVYKEYEEWSYNELTKMVESLDTALPQNMFLAFAKKIYKRQK